MTTTINASTSAGLVQSADTSGILQLQTANTAALTIDSSQNTTLAGYLNAPNTFGFKNRIINGAMMIDQRNAGASVTPTDGQFTLDRWVAYQSVASKYSLQQNAGSVTPPAGFINYLGVTSLSAYTVGAGEYFGLQQRIEGLNIADLAWGTASASPVTLSFWVRSSLTGTFGGALKNSGNTRSYPFTYTISSAGTWEQKTITILGDTTGTWLTTNGVGIQLVIGLGIGSTFSGTAGAWASANYWSATGATSVVGTNGATFYITGVQLEKGSTATAYDYRPYGTELALCQRYYYSNVSNAYGGFFGSYYTTTVAFGIGTYKTSMRTAPTIVLYDAGSNALGACTQAGVADNIAATAGQIGVNGFSTVTRTTGSFNATFGYSIRAGFTASAEL